MTAVASRRRLWITVPATAIGLAWLAGLVGFIASPQIFAVDVPRIEPPPSGRHNLLQLGLGPSLRASSFDADWSTHHHPLFLIDGRLHPQTLEKWVSSPRDRRPWVEARWRDDRELEEVVLRHAGSVEDGALAVRRYRLTCLDADGRPVPGGELQVDDNRQPLATHPLRCPRARGVRIDFAPQENDVVRLYEIQVWGR